MATITAKDVNELRKITGSGMMDCKKALVEADGDINVAIDILRKKGEKIQAKRSDREAFEGSVFARNSDTVAVLVELNCETDFVARNNDFQALGNAIAELAFQSQAADIDAVQSLTMEDGRAVSEHLTDAMGKIGEKVQVGSYSIVTGDAVTTYIHPGARVGVSIAFTGTNGADVSTLGKDLAMQIAAMKPISIDEDDVPADIVAKEMEIARDKAREEGKPENILDRIAEGTVKKFFKLNTLMQQDFVKDTSKTVGQYLKEVVPGAKIKAFSRLATGQ